MKQDKRFNYKEAEESGKKFVRYKDGCKVYGMGISKFQEIAKKANAVYKVNQMVLVNTEILDRYLERYRVLSKEAELDGEIMSGSVHGGIGLAGSARSCLAVAACFPLRPPTGFNRGGFKRFGKTFENGLGGNGNGHEGQSNTNEAGRRSQLPVRQPEAVADWRKRFKQTSNCKSWLGSFTIATLAGSRNRIQALVF